jgi:uncharacterized protein YbjT (DUF2867 family)
LRQLLADPAITQVISISRKSPDMPHGQMAEAKLAEILIDDLSALPSIESQMRGDLYFCCLGTTIKAAGSQANFEKVDHDAIIAFAHIAKTHDARSLVLVSAMGANAQSRVFYSRVKGRTEDEVKTLGLRSLTILRPALLVGPRREHRLAERLAAITLVPLSRLLPAGTRKKLVTPAEAVAKRMLAEAKRALGGIHIISAGDI